MTAPKRPSFDAFLAHDPTDNALAQAVIDRLSSAGVSAFSLYVSEPKPLDPVADPVRREIQDSFCFVALLTPAFLKSDLLPLHTGAASGLGTPTYLLTSGVSESDIPAYLRRRPAGELWGGLPAIAADIRRHAAPLPPAQAQALLDAYQEVGRPVDVLRAEPDPQAALADSFASKSRTRLPAERLLRELTRLRRSRKLPRLTSRAAG